MQFTIHYQVPSQNVCERRHWTKRRKEQTDLAWMIKANAPKWRQAKGQHYLFINAVRKRLISDYANLVGGCKGLVDALVTAGLLVDDSEKWVKVRYGQVLVSQMPGASAPFTEIEITEGEW